jgi:hypothetical protein
MLQRIQTLYLLVIVVVCILLFFFPMIEYVGNAGTYKLYITGMHASGENQGALFFWQVFPLMVLVILSLGMAAVTIVFYEKRRLQILLVSVNLLLNVVIVALVFLVYSKIFQAHLSNPVVNYQFGMYIPLISLVFLVLASRAIRKDEALVRSTDRLR